MVWLCGVGGGVSGVVLVCWGAVLVGRCVFVVRCSWRCAWCCSWCGDRGALVVGFADVRCWWSGVGGVAAYVGVLFGVG